MAYNLGALVTSMVVQGRQAFERDVDAAGRSLEKAADKSRDLGDALDRTTGTQVPFRSSLGQSTAEIGRMSDKAQQAATQVGTGLLAFGVGLTAFVGLGVAKYAEYDAAISRTIAVTGAYGEELQAIRDLTVDLGGSTVFTAREAAEGVTELGKAGVSTADILGGGLAGALDLAAAGEIAVADAAAIAATTLTQFKLEGRDATHVADLLAAGAGKAQGGVGDLSQALGQSGLVASQFGIDVEESIGTLTAFAAAGLLGSDAGTSFRTMLLNLATPTAQQAELLKAYNIEAYDAQGNFVGITSLAGQLQAGFRGVDQESRDMALGVIFGSDAIRAANVLYDEGAQGIEGWIGAVDDAGYAARVAATNQDNLRGDLEKLGGAFDTLMIGFGEGANGPLRAVVTGLADLLDGLAGMPPEMQQAITLGAALVGGIALIGGAALIAIPQVVAFRTAVATLKTEMPLSTAAAGRFARFLAGPWGVAIAGAAVGMQLLQGYVDSLSTSTASMTNTLKQAKTGQEILTAAQRNNAAVIETYSGDITKLNGDLELIADSNSSFWTQFGADYQQAEIPRLKSILSGIGEEFAGLASTDMPAAQAAFRTLATDANLSEKALGALIDQTPEFRDALIEQATALGINVSTGDELADTQALIAIAMGDTAEETGSAAAAYTTAREEVQGLEADLEGLLTMLDESNSANRDAISANSDYQQALDDTAAQVQAIRDKTDGYAETLDLGTQAGRDNMAMLTDLADKAWTAAEAQLAVDGNTANFQGTLESAREQVIAIADAMGYDADQAVALADSILRIPTKREVDIIAETAAAAAKIDGFLRLYNGQRVKVIVDTVGGTTYQIQGAGGRRFEADGSVRTRYMADGAVESMSTQPAQIRAPGSYVVWAEDETEGESFIPHAPSKRARSLELWEQTGRILGALPYADGGVRDGSSNVGPMRAGTTVNIMYPQVVDITKAARDAADILEAEQYV